MHAVFSIWDSIVGREISFRAKPHLIRGKVLWVNVSDSIWMQQLHLQKMDLLERINNKLGDAKLEDIRFQLDSRSKENPAKAREKNPVWPIDQQRMQEFERMISSLEDEEMKKSLKRLWAKFEGARYLKRE